MRARHPAIVNGASFRPQAAARVLLDVSGSRLRYILIAWPIATVPTLLLLPLLVYAATHVLHGEPPQMAVSYWLIAAAVIGAPPIETGLMLFVYYLLHLLIWRGRVLRVLVLAVLTASAHLFDGGWLRVIGVFWPFLVMSIALAAWEGRRVRDAFIVVTAIHALHNATLFGIAFAIGGVPMNARPDPTPWADPSTPRPTVNPRAEPSTPRPTAYLAPGADCKSSLECLGDNYCLGTPPRCQRLTRP